MSDHVNHSVISLTPNRVTSRQFNINHSRYGSSAVGAFISIRTVCRVYVLFRIAVLCSPATVALPNPISDRAGPMKLKTPFAGRWLLLIVGFWLDMLYSNTYQESM